MILNSKRKSIKSLLFITYCVFIIYYAVLSRESKAEHATEFRFMWAYREMLTGYSEWKEDVGYNLKNILFFVPFGFLFPERIKALSVFRNKRWLFILSAGMLFSVFIEVSQYITCCGLCETDDVLCNSFGSLIGCWLNIVVTERIFKIK